MQLLLALGVSLLAASSTQAQPGMLTETKPITVRFIAPATPEEIISTLAELSGTTIEWDQSVSEELRRTPIANQIVFTNATIRDALSLILKASGLSYRVVDSKTLLIFKTP